MEKILVTPRSYGKTNPALFEQLAEAGYEVVRNDVGGIFTKEQMIERIAPCVGVIIGVDPMDADVIAAAPKLRAISKYGVGVDNIDLDAAKARGIPVSRAVGANSEAVADYAFALMLALSRKVLPIDAKCRKDDWSKVTTLDVSHKTLGIFGMGAIGKHVARRAQGFSMKIMAYDVYWDEAFSKEHGVVRAEPEEIFKTCDFISLHLPLLPQTRNFIGEKELAMMKPTAILVNTARGGLIDDAALLSALKERRIYGAGLDAFAQEPPEDKSWYTLDNVILGSHCAASTIGATDNMGRIATENLLRDLASNK